MLDFSYCFRLNFNVYLLSHKANVPFLLYFHCFFFFFWDKFYTFIVIQHYSLRNMVILNHVGAYL
jgi:hypothetical protein